MRRARQPRSTAAAPVRHAPALQPGERISDYYKVVELVSETRNSRVYRALEGASGRSLAVKIPLLSKRPNHEFEQRFRRELSVAKRMVHRNVVTTVAGGRSGGHPYMAMEYMWGGTLEGRIGEPGTRIARAQALEWLFDITDALGYVHALGVVHRDLKPSNLFFLTGLPTAAVKVGEFGLAYEGALGRLTHDGVALGTPAYMSPEQVRGEAPTPAADVYALGALIHRLLNGKPPFEGSARQVMAQHLSTPPLKLRTYHGHSQLSASFIDMVDAMLAKRPGDRPGTSEVRAGLAALGRPA